MTIKERNALDLKQAWKKFIKEQERKHVKQGKQTQMYKGN